MQMLGQETFSLRVIAQLPGINDKWERILEGCHLHLLLEWGRWGSPLPCLDLSIALSILTH